MAIAWRLVRLKLALLRAGLRTAGVRGVIGLVFALGVAISVGFFGAAMFALVRLAPPATASTVVSGAFAFMLLIWVLGPVVTATSEGTLEADKLVLFPLEARQLMPGLLGAALAGFGGLASVLALGGAFVGMVPASPLALVTVLGLALQLALCATCSRLVGTAISGAARHRRWRDIALFAAPVVAIAINLGIQVAMRTSFNPAAGRPGEVFQSTPLIRALITVSRLLPSGPAALAVGYAREGYALHAVVALLCGGLVLAAALALWHGVLQRTLTSASVNSRASSERRQRRELFPALVRWLPRNRVGAVAAKDLRLTWRDPRQRAGLIGALFGAVIPLVSLRMVALSSPPAVLAAAGPAFFVAMTGTNLYGYDGAAHWTNVAAGDDARSDLAGKSLARVIVMAPLVAITLVALVVRTGSWSYAPLAICLSVASAGLVLGAGTVTSVRVPYAMPTSTTNVFSAGNTGQGMAAALPGLILMLSATFTLGPLTVAMVFWRGALATVVLGSIALLIGVGVFVAGFRVAVRWSAGRQAELLAALHKHTG